MTKIVLDNVQGGTDLSKINENFQKIEDEFNQKVFYRVNPPGEPNALSNNLDMNGFFILNSEGGGGGGGGGSNEAADIHFVPGFGIEADNVQDALEEVSLSIPQAAINTPLPVGVVGQLGSSMRFAREDHVHQGDGGGGGGGGTAISTGQILAYQRAVSPPVGSPGEITFDFPTASITVPSGNALANGWTKTIPAGTNPLYVTASSASSTGTTDVIFSNEWSTPVVLVENGSNGNNGLNVATVYIYKRSVTNAPQSLPSLGTTYQFNPPLLTGLNNGWTTTVPDSTGGPYLWVSTATAVSTTSTDIITSGEWAGAQILAQNGSNGGQGAPGDPGTRGTVNLAAGGFSSWSNTAANNVISSAGYGSPQNRDVVTLYGTSFSETRYYQSGSWLSLDAYLNGNMLVTGTLSASKVAGGILSGITIQIGSGHTLSNKAFEVSSGGVVYADNIFGGFFSGSNFFFTGSHAVSGTSENGSAMSGMHGLVASGNTNSGAKGVSGRNANYNKEGYLGTATHAVYAGVGGYGPFTGSHDVILELSATPEVGDIIVDVECLGRKGISNTIFKVDISSEPEQKTAVGVLENISGVLSDYQPAAFIEGYDEHGTRIMSPEYEAIKEEYNYATVNALGEGQINVTGEGGNIEVGDFIITSSTPGKGMRQADDVVHSYTVARARESCTFTTPGEQKQVACIYLCG